MDVERPSIPPEVWRPARRAVQALAAPIQRILQIEAASGLILLAVTVVALTWANVAPDSYNVLWHVSIGVSLGDQTFVQPLHFWINDGLMTIFFLLVGLEIRREIFEGELATFRQATLPLAAALGGMLVPAGIFVLLNAGRAGAAGWAIPMATDIAFAVGILTLLGSRVPPALRVLLLALAVIDDIGAIVVIAAFYSTNIQWYGFVIAAGGVAGVFALRWIGTRAMLIYVVPGAVLWAGLLIGGVHPTLAGVILGLLTPVRPWFGPSGFAQATSAHLDKLPDDDRHQLLARLDAIDQARREAVSPTERLIHALHPYIAFGIMPLFALANAGVVLGGADLGGDSWFLFIGIIAGLALGKPLGIWVATVGASTAGIASRSSEMTKRGVLLVGLTGGIGFTMSLFIANLAFPPGALLETAKLAILVGSGVAMVIGLGFGLGSLRKPRDVRA